MRFRTRRHALGLWITAAVFIACASCDVAQLTRGAMLAVPPARNELGSVVLVTLDGVRWQEIFHGVDRALAHAQDMDESEVRSAAAITPNLHRLMLEEGAAIGDASARHARGDMRASGPVFVSLPGYIEIVTGSRRSGCLGNDCRGPRTPTVLDELSALQGERPVVFASWPKIGRAAAMLRPNVQSSVGQHEGFGREQLAKLPEVGAALEAGAHGEWELADPGYRRDAHTAHAALAYLRAVHPRFAFVSLGDTDELGHADDYRGYLDALQSADRFIGEVANIVSAEIRRGRPTTLIVTTDHGRADSFIEHGPRFPESARVWLLAAGSGVTARGVVPLSRTRYLADIAPSLRQLLGLPAPITGRPSGGLQELFARPKLGELLRPGFTLAQSSASR